MGLLALAYGTVSYIVFLASFLYAIGFIGGFLVPKTIDSGTAPSFTVALITNVVLLGLFAVQHSVMARPAFKRWWTQIVPKSVERSTYVLVSSLLLALLCWQWQPMPAVIWHLEGAGAALLYAVFALGWLIVLLATFMINHFDLFGLRQVYLRMTDTPYTHVPFKMSAFYRFVRHPIMLGFIIAFWATPHMSVGHLVFAFATTAYIFLGVLLEERDLAAYHGAAFERYRQEVPMIVPRVTPAKPESAPDLAS